MIASGYVAREEIRARYTSGWLKIVEGKSQLCYPEGFGFAGERAGGKGARDAGRATKIERSGWKGESTYVQK